MAPAVSAEPARARDRAREVEPREASGITMRLILAYVEREGGRDAVDAMLRQTGLSDREGELRDENCWFADSTRVRLFEAAAKVLDDPDAPRRVGEAALDLQVGGALKLALRALGSPRTIYSSVPRINAKFNLVHRMDLLSIGATRARVRNVRLDSGPWHPVDCAYNIGLMSAAPGLFGRPPARVRHPVCRGHGADECIYEIEWTRDDGSRGVAVWALAGLAGLGAAALAAPALLPAAGVGAGGTAAVAATKALRSRRRRWRALRAQADQEGEAAERLNTSLQNLVAGLDLDEVLAKITHNAQTAVGGTEFALLVQESGAMRCRSSSGLPPESLAALERWAERTAGLLQAPLVLDDVAQTAELAVLPDSRALPLRSLCAAPLTFRDSPLGALVALAGGESGFLPRDVDLLQSYAAQAAIALTNARLYAAQEARASRDSLTGLLNHREFHETVARELERCRRYGGRMAVALFDLDDFKLVNDTGGHAAGDRVLCDFAAALGRACRASDLAFRIGGDEFALVFPEAELDAAASAAARVEAEAAGIDRRVRVSWGVAAWPDAGPTKDALLARADENLYAAKRAAPDLAPHQRAAAPRPASTQRARLALASRVSARLAPLGDPGEIARTAVQELQASFRWHIVAVLELGSDGLLRVMAAAGEAIDQMTTDLAAWEQGLEQGVNGRTARTGEPTLVADTLRDPDFLPTDGAVASRSELALPIRVAGEVWGVLNLEHTDPHAFGPDDLLFGDTIAAAIGAAVHRTRLFGELESAFMRTLAVLSDALEAKDAYTAAHAREVADLAETVGASLGLDGADLRTLRYGGLLHDVGKIAISTDILHKPGPLTDAEFEEIKRHTIIGAQMLERIPFFADVHPLVRSAHERWDGRGYPDGLLGQDIPLGARIICACDAWHAMTSDRPYRRALDHEVALSELREHCGTQFDPRVIDALLATLGAEPVRAALP